MDITFRVLAEERWFPEYFKPKYELYMYKVMVTSFPYNGEIRAVLRREGLRYAVGATYAGKVVHKSFPTFQKQGRVWDEIETRIRI